MFLSSISHVWLWSVLADSSSSSPLSRGKKSLWASPPCLTWRYLAFLPKSPLMLPQSKSSLTSTKEKKFQGVSNDCDQWNTSDWPDPYPKYCIVINFWFLKISTCLGLLQKPAYTKYCFAWELRVCTLINDDVRHVLRHRDGVDNCSDCPWRHGFKDTSSGSISSTNMGGKYLFLNVCLHVRVEAPFHVIVPKNNYVVTPASLGQT